MKMIKLLQMMFFGMPLVRYVDDPAAPGAPADPAPPADPADPAPADPAPADPAPADPAPADPADPGSALLGDDPAPADPVNYAEVELPEGVEMSTDVLEKYSERLNGAQITADQAKDLFPIVSEITADLQNQQLQAFEEYRETQRGEIAKMSDEDKAFAKTAALKFAEGDDEAMAALGGYEADKGWLVRMLARVGKAMGEDKFVEGGAAAAGVPETTKALFPSMQG